MPHLRLDVDFCIPKTSPLTYIPCSSSGVFRVRRFSVATFTTFTDSREKVREALAQVRRNRHFAGCRCGIVKGGFCSTEEATWSSILDRLLDKVPRPPAN